MSASELEIFTGQLKPNVHRALFEPRSPDTKLQQTWAVITVGISLPCQEYWAPGGSAPRVCVGLWGRVNVMWLDADL